MNLTQCNPEQQQAITHTSGPLLIIAGAGTGKTHVITRHILHLIEKGVTPSEILALTFTEKATQEMIERIDLELPLGYEELWIKTFHGFCDTVLKERGLEIGLSTDYKLLSKTEQWIFFKKNLFEFEFDYLRPLGNPTKHITALTEHFSRLKDENISPEQYQTYIASLDNKKDITQEEKQKAREIASAYEKYQKLMIKNSLLDFGDLITYTLELFKKRPHILKEYQLRFKHILVDEFQDSNYAQNLLIELLSRDHKNITVVGDDDQSIYKWRGASLTNILSFQKLFPDCKKVVLRKNYRSSSTILDFSHKIIQHNNPNRLEIRENISKKLEAVQEKSNALIKIIHAKNYFEEITVILDTIEAIRQKDNVDYGDFAILVRANSHAKSFTEECKRKNIPFHWFGNQGLFSKEEIKDLLAVIRIMTNIKDDIALFRLLSLPILQLDMSDISWLLQEAKGKHTPLFHELRKKSKEATLFQNKKIENIHTILSGLFEQSRKDSTSQILGEFLKKTGYLQNLIDENTDEAQQKLQNIAQFSEFVQKFENNNTNNSIHDFAEYLQLLEESGDPNNIEITTYENDNALNIMTVHGSKGLEFSYVFLVNLVKERFPGRKIKDPFEIPEELIAENVPEGEHHTEEERRLFYVGCTRAKKNLYLTYSDYYESGKKQWKASPFIEEAKQTGLTEEIKTSSDQTAKNEPATNIPTLNQRLLLQNRQHRSLRSLSYSQIETFQTCPYKYKLLYDWQVPTPCHHATSFGSSVHNTLNEFYRHIKEDKKLSTKENLKNCYEKHWIPFGYTSKAHENTRKKKGWEILETYFEKNKNPWIIPTYLERNFTLKIKNLIIRGRIDRIDKIGKGYEVIDYKTGSLRKQNDIDKDLQLSIYALACQNVYRVPIEKLSLYFLEDNEKISTTRTPQQLKKTEEELVEIMTKIQTSDHHATPSFMCQFCDFRLLCYAV